MELEHDGWGKELTSMKSYKMRDSGRVHDRLATCGVDEGLRRRKQEGGEGKEGGGAEKGGGEGKKEEGEGRRRSREGRRRRKKGGKENEGGEGKKEEERKDR